MIAVFTLSMDWMLNNQLYIYIYLTRCCEFCVDANSSNSRRTSANARRRYDVLMMIILGIVTT